MGGRLGSAEPIAKPTWWVSLFYFEADMEIEGRNFGGVFAVTTRAIRSWALSSRPQANKWARRVGACPRPRQR